MNPSNLSQRKGQRKELHLAVQCIVLEESHYPIFLTSLPLPEHKLVYRPAFLLITASACLFILFRSVISLICWHNPLLWWGRDCFICWLDQLCAEGWPRLAVTPAYRTDGSLWCWLWWHSAVVSFRDCCCQSSRTKASFIVLFWLWQYSFLLCLKHRSAGDFSSVFFRFLKSCVS